MFTPAAVEAGSQEVGKRKREDDMAALEAAVTSSNVSTTRLPGFVSGGTVQPDQRQEPQEDAADGTHPLLPCLVSSWIRTRCQADHRVVATGLVSLP